MLPARLAGITVAAEDAFVLPKLFEVLDFRPTFEAAAINAPMGWFDTPSGQYRPCDREARDYVGWPRLVGIAGTPCTRGGAGLQLRSGRAGAVDDQARPAPSALVA